MKYTKDHEWLRVEGDLVVVGITEHAATQLGDVAFVELPEKEGAAGGLGTGQHLHLQRGPVVDERQSTEISGAVGALDDPPFMRTWSECRGAAPGDRRAVPTLN